MIVLDHAPETPFLDPRRTRLPGLMPLAPDDWTVVHEDFAAQMAYRDVLLRREGPRVLAAPPEGAEPAGDLLETLCGYLAERPDYQVAAQQVIRPDGVRVEIDAARPLETVGRLVAEDFCLMLVDADGEHRLVAAVLCFPARWMLAEKMGRALDAIHTPVPDYDGDLARRVQRVFDVLASGRPLVRANWLIHSDPELFAPASEAGPRPKRTRPGEPLYLRTERQSLMRLPRTGAVAFGIKTSVTPVAALDRAVLDGLCTAFEARIGDRASESAIGALAGLRADLATRDAGR